MKKEKIQNSTKVKLIKSNNHRVHHVQWQPSQEQPTHATMSILNEMPKKAAIMTNERMWLNNASLISPMTVKL